MRATPILLLGLLLLATPTALADAGTIPDPTKDHDRDGDMELGPVCLWGFSDPCVLQAYECLQPYRPAFGITCP